MSRLSTLFSEKLVIPYIMVGDGGIETSKQLLDLYVTSGIKILEIGVPFSDPAADGATIQAASIRARKHDITLEDCLIFIAEGKKKYPHVGFVLMSYLNPILNYGIKNFFNNAEIEGIIIPDLPIEEYDLIYDAATLHEIAIIPLITIDTTIERMKLILSQSDGFVYMITLKGITGTQNATLEPSRTTLETLRTITNLPIVAGFGITNREQINSFHDIYDGVIVASEIIRLAQKFAYKEIRYLLQAKDANL